MLYFEWNEGRAVANRVNFADACSVFDDPFALDTEDRSMEYGVSSALAKGDF